MRTLSVNATRVFVGLVLTWISIAAVQGSTPNIVYIMADDLGIGDTGVTGQNARLAQGLPAFSTPNIDALAASGVHFKNMYAGGPSCSVSRAALLTGVSIGRSIIQETTQQGDLRSGDMDRTWGQTLQDAGYATGMFGKWHLGGFNSTTIRNPDAIPTRKGFEFAYGSMTGGQRRATLWTSDGSGSMVPTPTPPDPTWPGPGPSVAFTDDVVTSQAAQFIRSHAHGAQPFAAYIPLQAPHAPLDAVSPNHPYADKPWPQPQRDYAGMIWRLDENVGQILAAVDDPNGDGNTADSIAGDTIVVFTSDNGPLWPTPWLPFDPEFFDSNGIYTAYKSSPHAGGTRAPFFVRWNGVVQPGTFNDSYAAFVDVLPTFADLTGQDVPLGIDGKSFLPLITGEGEQLRPDSYLWTAPQDFRDFQFDGWAIQVGNWKLVKHRPTNTFKLYNLATNPAETVNLASSRPDIKAALEQIAHAEGTDREPSIPWTENPAVQVQQNTYFNQYKTWAAQNGSSNFYAAGNWSGGTQYAFPGQPEADNWNTGPADNWLATMNNTTAAPQQVVLPTPASVLALELRGDGGPMALNVSSGATLSARNGIRISSGGTLRLNGGELNTIREIDVRPGGVLIGEGLVNGQQSVIAGIPEFAGQGLFEPTVVNSGTVTIASLSPGTTPGHLTIQGDYVQQSSGTLQLDLFAPTATSGAGFDKVTVSGKMELSGTVQVSFAQPFSVVEGDAFNILTANGGITGKFDYVGGPILSPGLAWAVVYTSNSAQLKALSTASFEFFEIWKSSFGVNSGGDLDLDGDSDGFDFLKWQRQAGDPTPTTAVPEPPGLMIFQALGAVALAVSASRRTVNRSWGAVFRAQEMRP